ncbi:MAG: GNAT family N-acetyltransferase [Pseudomonadota bacterium]
MAEHRRADYRLRAARRSDVPKLDDLIRCSAHELSRGDYSGEQVDAALQGVFGVDTQLIDDGTYFVIEHGAVLAACGGWSFRATLFGNDDIAGRDPSPLDPATDAARIRAFFVHPGHARRGLGRWLLEHCEQAARSAGFSRASLGATVPGRRLYARFGYRGEQAVEHRMTDALTLTVYPMEKTL